MGLSTIFWLYIFTSAMTALLLRYPQLQHPPLSYAVSLLFAVLFGLGEGRVGLKSGRKNLLLAFTSFAAAAVFFNTYAYLSWNSDLSTSELTFFAISSFAIAAMLAVWCKQRLSGG